MQAEFPNAFQFLGGYFHQEYPVDSGNPDGALERFIADSPPETRLFVALELRRLLIQFQGKALARVIFELGCDYRPEANGTTTADWLHNVACKLEDSL